jgi:hypothetical protein
MRSITNNCCISFRRSLLILLGDRSCGKKLSGRSHLLEKIRMAIRLLSLLAILITLKIHYLEEIDGGDECVR